eukprot:m.52843 g.52843  ORF g.52843 m.52843 type:complete len:226 (+) comp34236_c0_seq7:3450-4127(+)
MIVSSQTPLSSVSDTPASSSYSSQVDFDFSRRNSEPGFFVPTTQNMMLDQIGHGSPFHFAMSAAAAAWNGGVAPPFVPCLPAVSGKDLLRSVLTSRGVTYEPEPKRPTLQITKEEVERKRDRREKNKVAAAKCRQKRRTHAGTVRQQYETLSKSNEELTLLIRNLESEVQGLQELLQAHKCQLSEEEREKIEKEIEGEAAENEGDAKSVDFRSVDGNFDDSDCEE